MDVDIMQQEMAAYVQGTFADLPAPLPFRNFVARARLAVSEDKHKSFFSDMLADVTEPTAPYDLLDIQGDGQNRGNSGVFLQDKYEVQVLDNNDNETYNNGQVASIYKQSIPLAKASVPTGDWNTYDIIYHAPEFDTEGKKTKSGTITVLHNGILVQDHFEIQGSTEFIGWPKNNPHGEAPIKLQDHNCDVSFRNIWVRKL